MQINKTSVNMKFSGIYKMPNTPENVMAIKQYVLPMYNDIKKDKIFIFPGNNPFKLGIDVIMDMVAKSHHSSREWVRMNAQNHGLDINNIGEDVIHIISSSSDVEKLKKYIKSRTSLDRRFFRRINRYFKFRNNKEVYKNIPEHLKVILNVLKRNKEEDKAFAQFAQKAIEVTSPQELLSFLIIEE